MTSDERIDKGLRPGTRDLRGFSLLEMMMVVTLILIIASISQPFYQTAIVRAREAALRQDLFTLRVQIDRFTADNQRAPASLEELVEKGYMGSIPRDPFTGSNETWTVDTTPAPPQPGGETDDAALAGIVDVHSGSQGISLEGTPHSSW
jgi:general secretion pathway protein G